ncbi:MAG: LPS-assembly protein LptD [Tabrizicola sp.]|nr:LPS-assembly protein LptD [Tabrizicola sp.]
MIRLLALLALLVALALPARAEDLATLISDRMEITGDTQLIADGNVEVFYKGRRLTASRIVYDQKTGRLEIIGPITLTEASGKTVILASQAELDADLGEGILTSARMVLNQQLQIAAEKLMRSGTGRTTMERVAASSCKVCEASPIPLWEVRARRVVHDESRQELTFDHAQFRLAGIPIFYIPRLRMPDPTKDRATGFLMPSFRSNSKLGSGLKLPYFIALGRAADLTLTPYLTTKGSQTLDLRYRQVFATGHIELTGAATRDNQVAGTRGYLFAEGQFRLPLNFGLVFRGQTATDPAYLLDYGIDTADRLDSRIEISRTRRNEHLSARIISFQTLRDGEDNTTIPSIISDITFHRRFSLGVLGGEGGLRFQTHNHVRTSTNPLDGPDSDTIADGRDLARVSARIDWRRSIFLPAGIEGVILGEATADAYRISDDAAFQGKTTRSHGSLGVELRWPWLKTASSGVSHMIEPVVQFVWAPSDLETLPNEDSVLVEFDEGNLFQLDRFPGSDAVERGRRTNIGIGWTRYDPNGWTLGVTIGRVFRQADSGQFGVGSGLGGQRSDWLAAATVDLTNGYSMTGRAVFDDDLSLTKGEARLALTRPKLSLSGSLIWAVADPTENRPDPTQEVTFDITRKITPNWTGKLSGRYDFVADQGTVAALGVEYLNECARFGVSLSRRFTSSTSVTPTTDFALSLELVGIGSSVTGGPARTCRQ